MAERRPEDLHKGESYYGMPRKTSSCGMQAGQWAESGVGGLQRQWRSSAGSLLPSATWRVVDGGEHSADGGRRW